MPIFKSVSTPALLAQVGELQWIDKMYSQKFNMSLHYFRSQVRTLVGSDINYLPTFFLFYSIFHEIVPIHCFSRFLIQSLLGVFILVFLLNHKSSTCILYTISLLDKLPTIVFNLCLNKKLS